MAKRFIDTQLFDDPWFMDLSKDSKIFWIYLITKCNHAGIIELNERLFKFQTGLKCLQTVIKELGNRLVSVRDQYYFIPKFLDFQYPNFPNSKVKSQKSAMNILLKFNINIDNIQTVSEPLDKGYGYDTDNGNDNGNDSEKEKVKEKNNIPTFKDFFAYAKTIEIYHSSFDFQIRTKYEAWDSDNWKDGNGNKIKNWKNKLNSTMVYFKKDYSPTKTVPLKKV